MGNLYCILGIDGSGKTTQAKRLVENLKNNRDIKIIYQWGKFESTIFKVLIALKNKIMKIDGNSIVQYHETALLRKKIFSNKCLENIYVNTVIILYFVQIVKKFVIPLKLGYNVVADRYYYDTIVDLAFEFNYNKEVLLKLMKKISLFCPTPYKVIYLSVPSKIAYNRKDDIPELDFLVRKKEYYDYIVKILDIQVLDGTLNSSIIYKTILRKWKLNE